MQDLSNTTIEPSQEIPEVPGTETKTTLSRRVLLAETEVSGGEHASRDARFVALALPTMPSRLRDADRTESTPAVEPLAELLALPDAAGPVFDVVETNGGEVLVMLSYPGGGVRVNGLLAPLVSVLRTGDVIAVGAGPLLHVSAVRSVDARPPTPEQVGRLCSLCATPIEADSFVYACACGNDLRHLEGEEKPEALRLVCARFGPCGSCDEETPTEPGFVYWPED